MGMPITIEIVGETSGEPFEAAYSYFHAVDERYSPYRADSELSRINNGLPKNKWSTEMKHIFALCEQTKQQTAGYFDSIHEGTWDPSGLVKGWAINQAATVLRQLGKRDFYIEAGGDIQVNGQAAGGEQWRVGIRSPFDRDEIIKVISIADEGVATSGTAVRGQHIYNPHAPGQPLHDVVSLTVIGPTIYDADRFATAAFAMGRKGIAFIEQLSGFEGYMVDAHKVATMTSGFERYVHAA
jgi:thiamine biosynthesis lipoprotein